MRRFLAGAFMALVVTLGFASAGAGATDHRRVIYIRNDSTALTDKAVRDALPAFQAALSKDFAPVWDADARLVYIGRKLAPAGSWRINLVDTPNCMDCTGYHEYASGLVRAYVGVKNLGNWQVTLTHELFEMEADPYPQEDGTGIRAVLVGTTWYAVETADPVEADNLSYVRKSASGKAVRISDFLTPEWFDPASDGPWDFRRRTTAPLQILPQGYQLVWRSALNGWEQLP